jgi:hypothetical protein
METIRNIKYTIVAAYNLICDTANEFSAVWEVNQEL